MGACYCLCPLSSLVKVSHVVLAQFYIPTQLQATAGDNQENTKERRKGYRVKVKNDITYRQRSATLPGDADIILTDLVRCVLDILL